MSFAEKHTLKKFVAKLERRGALPKDEKNAILGLQVFMRSHAANQDIVPEGDRSTNCIMIESGLVSRTRTLQDGARQIVSFGISGDMIDLQSLMFFVTDHGLHTHTPTVTLSVPHKDVLALAAAFPNIARCLWLDTLVDGSISREWTVNVGQRNARARTAHLLLEFAARFDSIGMLSDNSFELALSQTSLADALGMSIVHVNRTLQWLRGNGYIRTNGRAVTIVNEAEMRNLAGFNPAYLHLNPPQSVAPSPKRQGDNDDPANVSD